MADTIQCPYCCDHADLRPGCRACNGVGRIGCHDAPETAGGGRHPDPVGPAPVALHSLAVMGLVLYALDDAGRPWRAVPSSSEFEAAMVPFPLRWTRCDSPVERP